MMSIFLQYCLQYKNLRLEPTMDFDKPGDYSVGYADLLRIEGASHHDGEDVPVRIYYPAVTAGLGGKEAVGKFPLVMLNQGFEPLGFSAGINHKRYSVVADHLASFGYVVACADLSTNNMNYVFAEPNISRDAADTVVIAQNLLNALPGTTDRERVAFVGHSRGATAALMAVPRVTNFELRAVVAMAPMAYDGSPIATAANFGRRKKLSFEDFTKIPTLFFAATEDRIARPEEQTLLYDAAGRDSMFLEIKGGCHSFYKDNDNKIVRDGDPRCTINMQHSLLRRYVPAWLHAHVKGQSADEYVHHTGTMVMNDVRDGRLTSESKSK